MQHPAEPTSACPVIRWLTTDDEPLYRAHVDDSPEALVYATPEFRSFLHDVAGGEPGCLIAERDGRIVGSLPLFTTRVEGVGAIVNSQPWYGSHGGCTLTDPDDAASRTELLSSYRKHLAESNAVFATMVLTPYEEQRLEQYAQVLRPDVMDERVGQINQLPRLGCGDESEDGESGPPDGDAIADALMMDMYQQKTRNLVRKSLRQGFKRTTADDDEAWRFLHEVHTENMTAIGGRIKPWAHLKALRRRIPAEERSLSIAWLDREPVAALLLLHHGTMTEYFIPVARQAHRNKQPLTYLIHLAMIDAVARGDTRWNWGGTWPTQHSLHHFKRGWGAMDHRYSYLIHCSDRGRELLASGGVSGVSSAVPWYFLFPFGKIDAFLESDS
jgi:hypothetical protein